MSHHSDSESAPCVYFHRDCVQCRAFESPEKEACKQDCNYFELVKVKDRDMLPQPTDQSFPLTHCKVRDENDCWFYYTYAVRNQTKEVYVAEKLGMTAVLTVLTITPVVPEISPGGLFDLLSQQQGFYLCVVCFRVPDWT